MKRRALSSWESLRRAQEMEGENQQLEAKIRRLEQDLQPLRAREESLKAECASLREKETSLQSACEDSEADLQDYQDALMMLGETW